MKYRKHSTRDKAFVQVDGKRIYLPGKFNSPESLRMYYAIVRKNSPNNSAPRTISDLVVSYLDHCLVYYQNGTRGEYRNCKNACAYIVRHFGSLPIAEFTPMKMKKLREEMIKKDCSRSYVNQTVNKLKRMFKWGVENDVVKPSVYHALTCLAPLRNGDCRETTPVEAVPWRMVRLAIRFAHPMLADMLRLQWLIGCRPGEITNLRVEDVIIDGDVWEWQPAVHKNKWRGRRLSYFIGPLGQAYLKRWIDGAVSGYVFSPKRISNAYGLTYGANSYRQALTRACEKAGVPVFHPHQVRHSKATRMRSLYGIEKSRIVLGLASIDTAAIYAEASVKISKKIASRF